MSMPRVAVLGAGSWGTTIAKVFADAGCDVTVWARRAELASAINSQRQNPEYVPEVMLPPWLVATTDPQMAIEGAELVVLAVPAQTLRSNAETWSGLIDPQATVVSLSKGVELHSCLRMSEVIVQAAAVEPERVAVVSGPNLAREIAFEQPSATVVACIDLDRARQLQNALTTKYLRPYTNPDVIGVELGGAVKNVIALACGAVTGMGLGDNTRASLITRGLAETVRLGDALGADPMTFAGLAGLGDLVATCASPLSRNRAFGEHLGNGMTMAQARAVSPKTVEGVASCVAIAELARAHHVEMPITEQVAKLCHEDVSAAKALWELMSRETKPET